MKYLSACFLASMLLSAPAMAFNASSIHPAPEVTHLKPAMPEPAITDEIAAYIGRDNTAYDITAADILEIIKAKAAASHLNRIVLNDADTCAYVIANSNLRCTVANPVLVQDIARIPPSYLKTAKALGTLNFWNVR